MKLTNKPTRASWCYLQCLVLALLMSSCEMNTEEPCTHEDGHEWNKWEQVQKPDDYHDGWICSQRTCKHCGKFQGDSTKL